MKIIKTVGVVGAGTMGSALAQKFSQGNFKVILADRAMNFVEKGLNGIKATLSEAADKKVFTKEQVANFLFNLKCTDNLNDLKECDLVIEAIFEDFKSKTDLFRALGVTLNNETIIATNTSSFSVTELAKSIIHPERFIGLHYFYHAAKNRLIEIIPGEKTSSETFETAKNFSIQTGKDAISCKDSYGFVVNRYFVPWLNESVRLLEEGIANIPTIDEVCMETFGIGMGPFALMNATGVPVSYHAQKTLEVFGNFYKVAEKLKAQTEAKQNWDLNGKISLDETTRKIISERMLGIVFFVCSQLLDEKVCTATDINRGARIGLRWRKGPVELMKRLGEKEVERLIRQVCEKYKSEMPKSIGQNFWKMNFVELEKKGKKTILTMSRPEDLNALNEEVMKQLSEKFDKANNDKIIETIFLVGSGKAFVAGADIKFFVKNIQANSIDKIESFTKFGQEVFRKIDDSSKKVVAILNGIALGGGLELALCADVILALPKATVAFPETGIGIYPALGGTQRCAKRVGKYLSKYLIHTGRMLNAKEANEIGLVDKIISTEEMFGLLSGKIEIPKTETKTLNEKWQAVEDFFKRNPIENILSKRCVDTILTKEESDKLCKTINYKAPIALKISDKLIEEQNGVDSELEYLKIVFTSEDALMGLNSIGKKVEFKGA